MAQTLAKEYPRSKPWHFEQAIDIKARPQDVFAFVDDIHHTGWHMEKSSMPMMGGKMEVEILSKNRTGLGAAYRWTGRVLGMPIDFSETVVKYAKDKERVWRTIGEPKIIIIGHYEMGFKLTTIQRSTRLTIYISYELPKPLFGKFLGWLLSGWYSKWCLKKYV